MEEVPSCSDLLSKVKRQECLEASSTVPSPQLAFTVITILIIAIIVILDNNGVF